MRRPLNTVAANIPYGSPTVPDLDDGACGFGSGTATTSRSGCEHRIALPEYEPVTAAFCFGAKAKLISRLVASSAATLLKPERGRSQSASQTRIIFAPTSGGRVRHFRMRSRWQPPLALKATTFNTLPTAPGDTRFTITGCVAEDGPPSSPGRNVERSLDVRQLAIHLLVEDLVLLDS